MSLRIKTYSKLILFVLLLGGYGTSFATTKDSVFIPADSSAIEKRQPDEASQQDIYSDDDWKYITEENKSSSEDGFWDRLLNDLMRSLFDDMDYDPDPYGSSSRSSGVNWWVLFFILIGAALVIFFVVKATGAGGNTLFKGKTKRKEQIDATVEDVDIHLIDYDAQIMSAKSRNDFRLAVRLWFLRSLKEMSDRALIDWKINKTNSDYYYELSGTKYQKEFGKVSLLYDYVWYGEFRIDELKYNDAERELQTFHSNVKKEELRK